MLAIPAASTKLKLDVFGVNICQHQHHDQSSVLDDIE
jgi:hypothetical protein